jgi:hypothetical protein
MATITLRGKDRIRPAAETTISTYPFTLLKKEEFLKPLENMRELGWRFSTESFRKVLGKNHPIIHLDSVQSAEEQLLDR